MKFQLLRFLIALLLILTFQSGCSGGGIDGTGLLSSLSVEGTFVGVEALGETTIRVRTDFSDEEAAVTLGQPFVAEIFWEPGTQIMIDVVEDGVLSELVTDEIPSGAVGINFALQRDGGGFVLADSTFLFE